MRSIIIRHVRRSMFLPLRWQNNKKQNYKIQIHDYPKQNKTEIKVKAASQFDMKAVKVCISSNPTRDQIFLKNVHAGLINY